MLERMPERLFQEWQAYYEIEPFGNTWRQAARLCMVMQNMTRGKSGKALKEDDFMPTRPKPIAQPEKVRGGLLGWLMPLVKGPKR